MSRKTAILATLGVASFVAGLAGQHFWPAAQFSLADAVYAVFGAFLIFAWYRIDARERRFRRPRWLDVAVILLAIVAMPYYFFRTRGFRRGLVSIGLALLLMIATSLLSSIGRLTTWYLLPA